MKDGILGSVASTGVGTQKRCSHLRTEENGEKAQSRQPACIDLLSRHMTSQGELGAKQDGQKVVAAKLKASKNRIASRRCLGTGGPIRA